MDAKVKDYIIIAAALLGYLVVSRQVALELQRRNARAMQRRRYRDWEGVYGNP